MKRLTLIVLVMALWLASCSTPKPTPLPVITSAPVDSGMPVPQDGNEPVPTEMVVVPEGKIPGASFESQTYLNETVGFALRERLEARDVLEQAEHYLGELGGLQVRSKLLVDDLKK